MTTDRPRFGAHHGLVVALVLGAVGTAVIYLLPGEAGRPPGVAADFGLAAPSSPDAARSSGGGVRPLTSDTPSTPEIIREAVAVPLASRYAGHEAVTHAEMMLRRLEEEPSMRAAIVRGMRRVPVAEVMNDPSNNPSEREWTAEQVALVEDAVKPYDLVLDEAILEAHRQRYVTMRDRVLAGNFKTTPPGDQGQAAGDEIKRAMDAYEARTGVSEGHNVIVGTAPGGLLLTYTRGDPDGYVEAWDRIIEAQAEREDVIREAMALIGR